MGQTRNKMNIFKNLSVVFIVLFFAALAFLITSYLPIPDGWALSSTKESRIDYVITLFLSPLGWLACLKAYNWRAGKLETTEN